MYPRSSGAGVLGTFLPSPPAVHSQVTWYKESTDTSIPRTPRQREQAALLAGRKMAFVSSQNGLSTAYPASAYHPVQRTCPHRNQATSNVSLEYRSGSFQGVSGVSGLITEKRQMESKHPAVPTHNPQRLCGDRAVEQAARGGAIPPTSRSGMAC